jgi:hypothetical protein
MLKIHKYTLIGLSVSTFLAAGTAIAREQTPPPSDKVVMGQETVKQLLPLMADKSGKVSEEEFMKYMQAQFKSLHKDEHGRVDVIVADPPARPVNFSSVGK